MSLAQTPVPRSVPPTCLSPPGRQLGSAWCPQNGSWLSPNPQPPTHLPGSSPSGSRLGQAVLELRNKQGVTPGKGSTPTFPKILFHCWLSSPPHHQHLPGQAVRAHTPGWPGATARP